MSTDLKTQLYLKRLQALLDEEGLIYSCKDCEFFQERSDSHPYGDTTVKEFMWECGCEELDACVRLNEILEEEHLEYEALLLEELQHEASEIKWEMRNCNNLDEDCKEHE